RAIDLAVRSSIHLGLHTDSIFTACQYLHRYSEFVAANPPAKDDDDDDQSHQYDIGVVVATAIFTGKRSQGRSPLAPDSDRPLYSSLQDKRKPCPTVGADLVGPLPLGERKSASGLQ